MVELSESAFEGLISEAMDELSDRFLENASNVAIVWADTPTEEQRTNLKLRCNETLFGLYEGTPLTKRGDGYSLVLPDKITIFREPILHYCQTIDEVRSQVKHTLWHELGHHFGLGHDRIHKIEKNWRN